MQFFEYQDAALRTDNTSLSDDDSFAMATLGLVGEAGEVAEMVKKELYHGHHPGRYEYRDELGDVLWYLAVLADKLGFSLEEIAEANIAKLKKRYPEGFSHEASRSRPK